MFESVESVSASAATRMRGNGLHSGATHCTNIYVLTARAKWPRKTAENWAEAADVKPRMAKYWLAGHEVSPAGKLAIINLFR
jgi:hypothetical protein